MTTRVRIACPDNSHWHVKVDVQDDVYNPELKAMTGEYKTTSSVVLKQGEGHDTYITSSRRLMVTEIEPAAATGG